MRPSTKQRERISEYRIELLVTNKEYLHWIVFVYDPQGVPVVEQHYESLYEAVVGALHLSEKEYKGAKIDEQLAVRFRGLGV